jgi:hypothetical protein
MLKPNKLECLSLSVTFTIVQYFQPRREHTPEGPLTEFVIYPSLYLTRVSADKSDKHTSLLQSKINYSRKSFYRQCFKTFCVRNL